MHTKKWKKEIYNKGFGCSLYLMWWDYEFSSFSLNEVSNYVFLAADTAAIAPVWSLRTLPWLHFQIISAPSGYRFRCQNRRHTLSYLYPNNKDYTGKYHQNVKGFTWQKQDKPTFVEHILRQVWIGQSIMKVYLTDCRALESVSHLNAVLLSKYLFTEYYYNLGEHEDMRTVSRAVISGMKIPDSRVNIRLNLD